jgi:hypothetical protein
MEGDEGRKEYQLVRYFVCHFFYICLEQFWNVNRFSNFHDFIYFELLYIVKPLHPACVFPHPNFLAFRQSPFTQPVFFHTQTYWCFVNPCSQILNCIALNTL